MVSSHLIERLANDLRYYQESTQESLNGLLQNPNEKLSVLATEAYATAVRLAYTGQWQEARTMLAITGNAEAYLLELAKYPKDQQTVEIIIPSLSHSIFRQSTGVTSHTTPQHWLKAFYCSVIWWETPIIEQILLTVNPLLFSDNLNPSQQYRYQQIEALKALYLKTADTYEKTSLLLASFDFDMQQLSNEDRSFLLDIAMLEATLIAKIAVQDEVGFNQILGDILMNHEKYYALNSKLASSSNAWLSLPALGLTALAKHYGFSITVHSPYLPVELLSK